MGAASSKDPAVAGQGFADRLVPPPAPPAASPPPSALTTEGLSGLPPATTRRVEGLTYWYSGDLDDRRTRELLQNRNQRHPTATKQQFLSCLTNGRNALAYYEAQNKSGLQIDVGKVVLLGRSPPLDVLPQELMYPATPTVTVASPTTTTTTTRVPLTPAPLLWEWAQQWYEDRLPFSGDAAIMHRLFAVVLHGVGCTAAHLSFVDAQHHMPVLHLALRNRAILLVHALLALPPVLTANSGPLLPTTSGGESTGGSGGSSAGMAAISAGKALAATGTQIPLSPDMRLDVNQLNGYHESALHIIAADLADDIFNPPADRLAVFRMLCTRVSHDTLQAVSERTGESVFQWCLFGGRIALLRVLIETRGMELDLYTPPGYTPLTPLLWTEGCLRDASVTARHLHYYDIHDMIQKLLSRHAVAIHAHVMTLLYDVRELVDYVVYDYAALLPPEKAAAKPPAEKAGPSLGWGVWPIYA